MQRNISKSSTAGAPGICHIVDCGWLTGRRTSLLKIPIVPPLFSLQTSYLPLLLRYTLPSGFLYAVNWVIIRRRCVCRGAVLSVCGRINTQAPINLAWDDHWPRIRAGLFYWLKSERAFNIAPSPMTASYCPNPSITGSKGSSLANGHSKLHCFQLNTTWSLVYLVQKPGADLGRF